MERDFKLFFDSKSDAKVGNSAIKKKSLAKLIEQRLLSLFVLCKH